MPAVVKIALGNLWEHKSKTIILGLLISIGVAIIIIGNAFLEASKTSMQRDLVENYTGDVMIQGPESDNTSVSLFGVAAVSMNGIVQAPAIPDMDAMKKVLAEYDAEKKVIRHQGSAISNTIMITSEAVPEDFQRPEGVMVPYGYVFAGSPDYYEMFDGIRLIEGNYPSQTEPEILIEDSVKESFEAYYGIPLSIGDPVIVVGAYNQTIREVKVCGVYRKGNADSAMIDLCYMDPNTARSLADLTYGSIMTDLFDEQGFDLSISSLSEDDLFGGFDDFDMFEITETEPDTVFLTDEDYDNILGDTTLRDLMNTVDDGAWNFHLIKLRDSSKAPLVVAELNALFQEKGIECIAKDWEGAAGSMASSTTMLSGVFTVMIVILAVVVFIVIMNTLVVSIFERTGEIGTMRALGGSKSFVRKLFFTEAVTISGLSSLAGVVVGLLVCYILNACHITVGSDSAKLLLGSANLGFIPTFSSVASTALIIMAGSILADLYPVSLALRITPLKAMNQGE